MKKEVNYREDVANLVDDIKEQLLSEFMKSENKDDKDRIKWMILDGRTLDMLVATAEKLQTIQDSLDILMAAVIKEEDET